MKKITPREAQEMLENDRESFVYKLAGGEFKFDDKYITYRRRIRWTPWPRIDTVVEIYDGPYGFTIS